MATKAHTHRALKDNAKVKGWSFCVKPDLCASNPARQSAHGSIVIVDVCACGATRNTESNFGSANRGGWVSSETED